MKNIFVTESQFRKIVSEGLKKGSINESFASNAIKQAIMQNGGIDGFDKDYGAPVGWDSIYGYPRYPMPGILDKLTDKDLIYRALHLDEFNRVLHVRCKNGTELTIPVSDKEDDEATRKHEERSSYSKWDDGKEYYQPETDKFATDFVK